MMRRGHTVALLILSTSLASQSPTIGISGGLRFIENRGQWDTEASLVARLPGGLIRLEESAIVLQRHATKDAPGWLIRQRFEGATRGTSEGVGLLAGVHHFLLGNNPAKWRTSVPTYSTALISDLYPGVDLIVSLEANRLEYTFRLAPVYRPRFREQ